MKLIYWQQSGCTRMWLVLLLVVEVTAVRRPVVRCTLPFSFQPQYHRTFHSLLLFNGKYVGRSAQHYRSVRLFLPSSSFVLSSSSTTSRMTSAVVSIPESIISHNGVIETNQSFESSRNCSCTYDNNDNDDDTTTTTIHSLPTLIPSLQSYMLQRNVTIRSVNWCTTSSTTSTSAISSSSSSNNHDVMYNPKNTDASTLLQIYQGTSVPPVVSVGTTVHDIISNSTNRMVPTFHESGSNIMNMTQGIHSSWHNGSSSIDASRIASILQKRIHQDRNPTSNSSSMLLSSYKILSLSMKISAELRATRITTDEIIRKHHLQILYVDDHICVVHKPSGILSVPGPRRNPNICEALYYVLNPNIPYHATKNNIYIDQMVVHRLDMDTSGILIMALSKEALHQLHTDFRQRQVTKVYQALLCHHIGRSSKHFNDGNLIQEYDIDVDLERDPDHPPFMRIAQTPNTQNPKSHSKFLNQESKPSWTEMHILSYEYINETIPVTRVQLIPRTGRTHQLRVHTAQVLQHPIVGDDIYGYGGECFPYRGDDEDDDDDDSHETNDDSMWNVQRQLAELGLPLCLHAQKLYIRHPISGAPMIFECQPHF